MLKSLRTLHQECTQLLVIQIYRIEIVHCTSPSLSQLLFNNGNGRRNSHILSSDGCAECRHHMVNDTGVVCSSVTRRRFKVNNNFNCSDGGIYVIRYHLHCAIIQEKRSIMDIRSNGHFLHGRTAISHHPIFRIVMFATMLLILNLLWLKTMLIGASIPFLRENNYGIVE